jgi:hypothetical protein
LIHNVSMSGYYRDWKNYTQSWHKLFK